MGKKIKDPGVGNSSVRYAKRMINDNGFFNVIQKNKARRFSEAYNYLVHISWWQFFSLSLCSYILANIIFATIYVAIGIEEIINSTGIKLRQKKVNLDKFSVEDLTEFPISNTAVTASRKKIKNVIDLDTNIQIKMDFINPDSAEKFVEKGWDEEKQMYYYLVYFNKEQKS